ncbi:hypothetical protein C8Q79DRAFT_921056 [Trametes meyenii]|nr:hypothetical protein C8Q79DRAFT_921056 [Trametes meyenii]
MARGVASPAPNVVPKPSFVKVTDEVTQQPPGVHDHVAKSYGYNDFNDEFILPEEHYIRYIEPLESDLATQVEYDMDEQDQEWLDAVNLERKAQQLDKVSYESFEIIMDRLEKEWFDLSKNIPKSDMALPSEDSTCAICDDSEGENTNAIVFCDGCNLAVHQDCYGVPYIPEGQWLCRKCTVSPENPVSCILCPNEGGAFKQTVSGDWVHLLCAIWVPETAVANEVFMEPITGVEKISKQRWRLRCSVCDVREGACIQCSKASCFIAFHATCARKEKLLMPMKASQGSEAPTLACYCEKHLPREQYEVRAAALRALQTDVSDTEGDQLNAKSNKAARAYAKTYKPGPPLVPRIIVTRISQYIQRIPIRHKLEFLHLVCKYWSLKREARRGAPLLKRLHLEPWTASAGSKQQTDEEKVMKLDHMRRLRLDLERVRLIIDVIRHREATKQRRQEQIQLTLSRLFFPHEPSLRFAFEKIISHDRQGYFKSPVNKNEVPDYYDIIQDPMCWDIIDRKLDGHEYLDLSEFKRDVELVVANAMAYNQINTPFYKTALRIRGSMPNILGDLDRALGLHPLAPKTEQQDIPHPLSEQPVTERPHDDRECDKHQSHMQRSSEQPKDGLSEPESTREHPLPPIGDLEPPHSLLELLVSEELVRQDTNMIMMTSPIESLINYELPNIRPPAPPPPPPKPKPKPKSKEKPKRPKMDRKAALERKRQERLRALDSSPGFRAPRTRAAMAAAAAFEAEVAGSPQRQDSEVARPPSAIDVAEGVAGPSRLEKSPRKPRKSAAPPPRDIPLTVDEVDNRKSFTMFERGWILPPDQKRGGRSRIDRPVHPPPRKKAKTSHESHHLSISGLNRTESGSSRAGENETGLAMPDFAAHNIPAIDASHLHILAAVAAARDPSLPHSTIPEALAPDNPPPEGLEPESSVPHRLPEFVLPDPSHTSVPMQTQLLTPEPQASTPIPSPSTAIPSTSETAEDASMEVDEPAVTNMVAEPSPIPISIEPERPPVQIEEEQIQPEETSGIEGQGSEMQAADTRSERMEIEEMQTEAPVDAVSTQVASVEETPVGEVLVGAIAVNETEGSPVEEPLPEESSLKELPLEEPPLDEAIVEEATAQNEPVAEAPPLTEASVDKPPSPLVPSLQGDEKKDAGPRRIIIIEELDTPATRREKNLRKKLQRQAAREAREASARAAVNGSMAAPTSRHGGMPVAGPSRLREASPGDDDSDLTDLSDEEDTQQGEEIPSEAQPGVLQQPEEGPVVFRSSRRAPPPAVEEPGAIILKHGERLEGGTLVWAKIESFPWWPAVVFEEDDLEIPESVLARAPPREADLVLVRFYEKKHINNWAWVRHRNMRYLGEDDSLDAQMLAPTSKYQRWRSASRRTECRNAYQDALAEMEADAEAAAAQEAAGLARAPSQNNSGPDPSFHPVEAAMPQGSEPVAHDLVPAAMGADSPMTDVDWFD